MPEFREKYDIACARAVSNLRENVAEEVASTNGLFSFEDACDWQRD